MRHRHGDCPKCLIITDYVDPVIVLIPLDFPGLESGHQPVLFKIKVQNKKNPHPSAIFSTIRSSAIITITRKKLNIISWHSLAKK